MARGRQKRQVNRWLAPRKGSEGIGRDQKGSFCPVVNPQMPEDGLRLPALLQPPSHLTSLGTDKQHTLVHRGQVFSSKAQSWIYLVNLDTPL